MPKKILLVEDDLDLACATRIALELAGYEVGIAHNLVQAQNFLSFQHASLILLDINLGTEDGRTFCRAVRATNVWRHIPIIFVSVADDIEVKLSGFRIGADDYLCKPFAKSELIARIEAVLRRSERNSESPAAPTADSMHALISQLREKLTRTETRILNCLLAGDGRLIDREKLRKDVWLNTNLSPKTVDTHINNLRNKVRQVDLEIDNTYGIGYKLIVQAGGARGKDHLANAPVG